MSKLWKITRNVNVWTIAMFAMLSITRGQVVHAAEKALTPQQAIQLAAFEYSVDVRLMMAIAHVESSMNPKAVGSLGEIGLFQLRPHLFPEGASFDALTNARAAAKHLKWLAKRPGCTVYGKAYFVCHNRGAFRKVLDNVLEDKYYKSVSRAYKGDILPSLASQDD